MPSVNQIKNTGQVREIKAQKLGQYKWLKYLILAFIAGALFRYFFVPKIEDIPQEVYNKTTADSQFYSVIHGRKKIVWFGADCQASKQRQIIIDILLENSGLNSVYEHRAFLQNSMRWSCYGKDCVDELLIENCSGNLCIVVPSQHKFIKVDFDDVNFIKILRKVESW